jgi:hypothetical protein
MKLKKKNKINYHVDGLFFIFYYSINNLLTLIKTKQPNVLTIYLAKKYTIKGISKPIIVLVWQTKKIKMVSRTIFKKYRD